MKQIMPGNDWKRLEAEPWALTQPRDTEVGKNHKRGEALCAFLLLVEQAVRTIAAATGLSRPLKAGDSLSLLTIVTSPIVITCGRS